MNAKIQSNVRQTQIIIPSEIMPSLPSTNLPSHSFTLFPFLPPELRVKIWRSSFTPRILELRLKLHSLPQNISALHFTSYCPLPIALSINSESRHEALRDYRLAFESKDYYPNTSPLIYVNFDIDTIYLDSQTFDLIKHPHLPPPYIDPINPLLRFLDSTTTRNSNSIKNLAIDEKIWLSNPDQDNATNLTSERKAILSGNARAIQKFEGLEELAIVHHGINISVPCTYSYLRTYEIHKAYISDRESRQPPFGLVSLSQHQYQRPYPSSSHSKLSQYNTLNPDVFVRYLDKPAWSPLKKSYPSISRGDATEATNSCSKKEFDERYNEIGGIPIYGCDLEGLERGELRFFELEGYGKVVDFMDGVKRGCVAEDKRALEREKMEGGKGWEGVVVRSVGLIRGGKEC